jgi:beta-1,4-N-acetylglucosaminyltransferase
MDSSQDSDSLPPMELPMLKNRKCFVTVGATAGFRPLLEKVADSTFFGNLSVFKFTELEVQCGPDLEWFEDKIARMRPQDLHGLKVTAFDFTDDMKSHLLSCRGEKDVSGPGCVIAHAGKSLIFKSSRRKG